MNRGPSRSGCISRRAWGAWLLGLVLQLSALPASALDARVRVSVEPEREAWIGEQLILKVDLMTNGLSFSDQRIHLPDVPGALVLEDTVTTVKLSEQVEDETWQVLRYDYPLFAQRPGRIEVAPVNIAFAVSAGFGSDPEHYELQTEALAFEVQTPPGAADPARLVTTTNFSMKVAVTPDPTGLAVGDAVTRTVTRSADAVSGMAFAPLPLPDIAGVAAYPRTPEVDDRSNRGMLTGTRVESVSYVLQKAGKVSIPGIELQWWDPVAEKLNTERIAPLDLDVADNPGLVSPVQSLGWIRRIAANEPWMLLGGGGALAAVAWALVRWLPPGIRCLRRRRRARQLREAARFKALIRACSSNDPVRVYNAYLAWLSAEDALATDKGQTLSLDNELERLQTALVRSDRSWRSDGLVSALRHARNAALGNLRKTRSQALPALNP